MARPRSASSTIDALACSRCPARYDPRRIALLCACGAPLLARYRVEEAARTMTMRAVRERPPTMWRYREMMPGAGEPLSLGEGMTPLHHARRLGASLGLGRLYIKDEAVNPTGSFKARGLSAAMTVARDLGVEHAAIPSAGNAGGALAAYAALAGIEATVFLPEDTPAPFFQEAAVHGADVRRVRGSIADCARELGRCAAAAADAAAAGAAAPGAARTVDDAAAPCVSEAAAGAPATASSSAGVGRAGEASAAAAGRAAAGRGGLRWYDVSTLKEPYRIEGKKTMGYELAEQMDGRLPDVIIYPTGGGTGLIGMWKAFDELERLGWVGPDRPRMISVQAAGCAPIVRAFESGAENAVPWDDPRTCASGLRVPAARGDRLMLEAIRSSGGEAVAVTDHAMISGVNRIGRLEGIHACPEGGATLAALEVLLGSGKIGRHESIVLFNTGTGLKYPESLGASSGR